MENDLMKFRLGYLRAIAKAWSNDDDEKKLLNDDNIDVSLKKTIASTINPSNPEDPRIHIGPNLLDDDGPFKDYFGNIHLGNVSIRVFDVEDNPTKWDLKDGVGWTGSNDFFIIHLPKSPAKQEKQASKENAIYLAEYYHKFPTFFGVPNDVNHTGFQAAAHEDRNEVVKQALPTDLGVSPGPFLEFGGVILRALALAWQRDDVFDALTDPKMIDATPVLSKYLAYNNPWNFNLRFIKSESITLSNDNSLDANTWENPPQNIVLLHYPCRPEEKADRYPMALASYNETGPAYPFTCT